MSFSYQQGLSLDAVVAARCCIELKDDAVESLDLQI